MEFTAVKSTKTLRIICVFVVLYIAAASCQETERQCTLRGT